MSTKRQENVIRRNVRYDFFFRILVEDRVSDVRFNSYKQ